VICVGGTHYSILDGRRVKRHFPCGVVEVLGFTWWLEEECRCESLVAIKMHVRSRSESTGTEMRLEI
jgi:hypothetical protein